MMTDGISMLIDGHNLMIRAKHSKGVGGLATSDGKPSGMLYGSITNFLSIVRSIQPNYALWLFDWGKSTYRSELYPEYKANRPKNRNEEDGFHEQYDALREFLDLAGFKWYRDKGIEADDHIAKLSRDWEGNVVIVSSDHDLHQLVNHRVMVYLPSKPQRPGANPVMDVDSVTEKYGLPPHRLAEAWSLIGDSSDNITGVSRVGPKTAVKLLQDTPLDVLLETNEKIRIDGSTEGIVKNFLLIDLSVPHSDVSLAKTDCPMPTNPKGDKGRTDALMAFFETWEFDSLARLLQDGNLW